MRNSKKDLDIEVENVTPGLKYLDLIPAFALEPQIV